MTSDEAIVQLAGSILNLSAEALRQTLQEEARGECIVLDYEMAEHIYNTASAKAVEFVNMAFAQEAEPAGTRILLPGEEMELPD